MAVRTGYPDGAPCWADLSTPDLAAAQRFYGGLFGWTFTEPQAEMGNYTMAQLGGRNIVGMAPKMPGQDMPTVWSVYLKTSNADETAKKVTDNGGQLLWPPMDIPGAGRMLFAVDPTGAAFGAWQPLAHTGAQLFDEAGAMCWHELATRDAERADGFYRSLFPYEQAQVGDGKNFDYTVWKIDGHEIGGRLKMTAEWEGIPPHWTTYFAVANTDASVARVRELGGQLKHGPFDSPHGRIAVVADPHGAIFSIIQLTQAS
jgi:predicted enzyme related to lactoylglutathione lyase